MRLPLLIVATLICVLGWWLGVIVGIAISLLAVAGLALARWAARRAGVVSGLAALRAWQVALPALIGLPAGLGLSLATVVFGPGF